MITVFGLLELKAVFYLLREQGDQVAAKKVLIVDASVADREKLRNTLVRVGYEPSEAESGADALARISGERFDLLIADLDLPEINGVSFVSALRKIPGQLFTPVIIVAEGLIARRRSECISAGVSGYIQKPFHQEQVLSILRMIIQ